MRDAEGDAWRLLAFVRSSTLRDVLRIEQLAHERVSRHSALGRNVRQDGSQGAYFERRVRGHGECVWIGRIGEQPNVAAGLPHHAIADALQRLDECPGVARGAASCREDFIPDVMQSNDARGGALVEVAAHGVASLFAQVGEVLGLHEDGLTERARVEAAFEGIFNEKDDFGHWGLLRCVIIPQGRANLGRRRKRVRYSPQ